MDYRETSAELKAAWFAYKAANPGKRLSLVAFVAGFNAAKKQNPVCPYCHEEMTPTKLRSYYDCDYVWLCSCHPFPDECNF